MKTNDMKRKVLKDRNFPNSEQIAKRQDFNPVNQSAVVMKKILIKKALLWAGGSVVTASVIVTAVYLSKTEDTVKPDGKHDFVRHYEQLKPYIQSPLPGKQTEFAAYRISAKNGGTIHYGTGSVIEIPAGAFVNKNGKPVSDSVEVKYREFHNPMDIFLSGIPMDYDSAGTKYTLESAGMLEILAFDNGESLTLNEKTPVEIKMASAAESSRFNLYELDTVNRNWVCKGKDKIALPGKIKSAQKNKIEDAVPLAVQELIKPELISGKYSFKISYDKNTFPELAAYDNVQFESTDNNFKPSFYRIDWSKISLYPGEIKGIYTVKLKKADTIVTVNAKPVFEKGDYERAVQKFDMKIKEANKMREEKEAAENAKLEKVNKELSTYNRDKMVNAAKGMASVLNSIQVSAFRSFRISAFGLFNCDAIMPPLPLQPVVQYANAVRKDGWKPAKLEYSTIYMLQNGVNSVFRFSSTDPVRFNPAAQNLIWTLTDKREFAFFRTEDFNRLAGNQKNTVQPVIETDEMLALNKIKNFLGQ